MTFSSPTFLFGFLPFVLVAVWCSPLRARRFVLLAAGGAFYVWAVQELALLVAASTLVDWALARGVARSRAQGRSGRPFLLLGVTQNLLLLGWFKYAGFFSEQANRLAIELGLGTTGVLEIALPVGVSFYVFEKISYLVDVSRGDVEARRDPVDLLLFVSLFPRATAGPIVRLREIQDDLRAPRPRPDMVQAGAIRFAHGLVKKLLVADSIAPVADAAFAAAADGTLNTGQAWLGAIAFTLQLYYDFSGYSDMAIGIGLMLGFRLPENFNRPYASLSVTEFWRRWHMSLSRWFRDYVYVPLGGSRRSGRSTVRNLLVVFVLTGLWHGAGWTFLVWGLYHGAWLLLERRMGWRTVDGEVVRHRIFRRGVLLLAVTLGWVMFRADTLPIALDYYGAMFVPTGGTAPDLDVALSGLSVLALTVGAVLVLAPQGTAGGRWLADGTGRTVLAARTGLLAIALPAALITAVAGDLPPFLYHRF